MMPPASEVDGEDDVPAGLIADGLGMVFQHLGGEEAEFLYEEIFVRQAYTAHGLSVPAMGRPVVVDVGANIGLFSLFCHRCNPQCVVVAVEPAPAAFAVLERNLSHLSRARCVQRALAESETARGALTVYLDAPGESSRHPRERAMQHARLRIAMGTRPLPFHASAALTGAPDGVEHACSVGTLSGLLEELAIKRVDLLKIDCEGDELRVLHGLRPHDWPRLRQVVLEVHDVYGRLRATVALLRRHGFAVRVHQQRGGTVQGYQMVVPETLRLFYVYATRRPRKNKRRRGGSSSLRCATPVA